MKRPRKHISQRTMKVAALRELAATRRVERDGKLVPALTYEQAKAMTEEQIEALWHWDHIVPHAIGGACQHHNLQPMLKPDHAVKTAKKDVPAIAKAKRVEEKHKAFRDKILRKTGQSEVDQPAKTSHNSSRNKGWPQGRKMQSRPFAKRDKQDV